MEFFDVRGIELSACRLKEFNDFMMEIIMIPFTI